MNIEGLRGNTLEGYNQYNYTQNLSVDNLTVNDILNIPDLPFSSITNLTETIDSINNSFVLIDNSFISINNSLGVIDNSFITINNSLGVIDNSFISINNSLDIIDNSFISINNNLGVIDNSFISINNNLGTKQNTLIAGDYISIVGNIISVDVNASVGGGGSLNTLQGSNNISVLNGSINLKPTISVSTLNASTINFSNSLPISKIVNLQTTLDSKLNITNILTTIEANSSKPVQSGAIYTRIVSLESDVVTNLNLTETYKNNACLYRDLSKTYSENACDYMDLTETLKNETIGYKNETETLKNNASSYTDQTLIYKNDTETLKNNACVYVDNACAYVDNACVYVDNACAYADNACVYVDNACAYADNACAYANNACAYVDNCCAYLDKLNELVGNTTFLKGSNNISINTCGEINLSSSIATTNISSSFLRSVNVSIGNNLTAPNVNISSVYCDTLNSKGINISASGAKLKIVDIVGNSPSIEFVQGYTTDYGGDVITDWKMGSDIDGYLSIERANTDFYNGEVLRFNRDGNINARYGLSVSTFLNASSATFKNISIPVNSLNMCNISGLLTKLDSKQPLLTAGDGINICNNIISVNGGNGGNGGNINGDTLNICTANISIANISNLNFNNDLPISKITNLQSSLDSKYNTSDILSTIEENNTNAVQSGAIYNRIVSLESDVVTNITLTETYKNNACLYADNASAFRSDAEAQKNKAKDWATDANGAQTICFLLRDNASTYARNASTYARNACINADNTCVYRDQSLLYKNNACVYVDNACVYVDNACVYVDNVCAYMDLTETLKNETIGYKNETETLKNNACVYLDQTLIYKNDTETLKNNTCVYTDNACVYADNACVYMVNSCSYMVNSCSYMVNACSYMVNAKSYRDTTLTYQNNASTYKNQSLTYSQNSCSYRDQTLSYLNNVSNLTRDSLTYRENCCEYADTALFQANRSADRAEASVQAAENAGLFAGAAAAVAGVTTVESIFSFVTRISNSDNDAQAAAAAAEAARNYRNDAGTYAESAQGYSTDAYNYKNTALSHSQNACGYKDQAYTYRNNALTYQNNASTYKNTAYSYMVNTSSYMVNTSSYMANACSYMTNAYNYMANACLYADNSCRYADFSLQNAQNAFSYKNDAEAAAEASRFLKGSDNITIDDLDGELNLSTNISVTNISATNISATNISAGTEMSAPFGKFNTIYNSTINSSYINMSCSNATLKIIDLDTDIPSIQLIHGTNPNYGADGTADWKLHSDSAGHFYIERANNATFNGNVLTLNRNGDVTAHYNLNVSNALNSSSINTSFIRATTGSFSVLNISDNAIGISKVNGLSDALLAKQANLSAGIGINICNNIISVDVLSQILNGGSNINISNETINLNSSISLSSVNTSYIRATTGSFNIINLCNDALTTNQIFGLDSWINGKQNLLTAGTGINISNDEISVDVVAQTFLGGSNINIINDIINLNSSISLASVSANFANFSTLTIPNDALSIAKTSGLQSVLNSKQNKLTAGININICNDIISTFFPLLQGTDNINVINQSINLCSTINVSNINTSNINTTTLNISNISIANLSTTYLTTENVRLYKWNNCYNEASFGHKDTDIASQYALRHNPYGNTRLNGTNQIDFCIDTNEVMVLTQQTIIVGEIFGQPIYGTVANISIPDGRLHISNGDIYSKNINCSVANFSSINLLYNALDIENTCGLQDALDSKQGTLTAGSNITITGNTISATAPPTATPLTGSSNISVFNGSIKLNTTINISTMNSSTANISTLTIPNNALTIAKTNGLQTALDSKQATLTGSSNISVSNGSVKLNTTINISTINSSTANISTLTIPNNALTIAKTTGLQTAIDSKQATLIAGNNISINGNTISAIGSGFLTGTSNVSVFNGSVNLQNTISVTNINSTGDIASTGRILITGTSPTLYLRDTDHRSGMIHMNSNRMYFLSGVNNSTNWSEVNGRWPLYLQTDTNEAVFGGHLNCPTTITAGGLIQAEGVISRSSACITSYANSNGAFAQFSHKNLSSDNAKYALLQEDTGQTYLNAGYGQKIRFRVDNQDRGLIDDLKSHFYSQVWGANARIGNTGPEVNAVSFGHVDLMADSTAAVCQNNVGKTWMNCTAGQQLEFRRAGSYRLKLDSDGSGTFAGWCRATQLKAYSDDRLKHNEIDINGLEIVRQLNPKKYDKTFEPIYDIAGNPMNDYNGPIEKEHFQEAGLIAQELLETNISWVVGEPSKCSEEGTFEPYTVDYNSIMTYGIQAIKELDVIVQRLEKRIGDVEAENDTLTSRIQELENNI